jgi:hypothetical protein
MVTFFALGPTLTIQERRRLMHGLLEQVVSSERIDERHARPVGERTEVVLRGGTVLVPALATAAA